VPLWENSDILPNRDMANRSRGVAGQTTLFSGTTRAALPRYPATACPSRQNFSRALYAGIHPRPHTGTHCSAHASPLPLRPRLSYFVRGTARVALTHRPRLLLPASSAGGHVQILLARLFWLDRYSSFLSRRTAKQDYMRIASGGRSTHALRGTTTHRCARGKHTLPHARGNSVGRLTHEDSSSRPGDPRRCLRTSMDGTGDSSASFAASPGERTLLLD